MVSHISWDEIDPLMTEMKALARGLFRHEY
jgi:hypothetical protein